MASIALTRPTHGRSTPSPTRAQRRLLAGLTVLLAVHVMAAALYVIGG
ncbi:MAG: hypothetical protein AAF081_09935 [Actinomycetota bacterium]